MRALFHRVLSVLVATAIVSCAAKSDPLHHDDNEEGADAICSGSFSHTPSSDGTYYATDFGCYKDSSGHAHQDPGDNCIPSCLAKAQASVCANMSGPACEESLSWYSADAARFGCMAHVKVTSMSSGKSVVVVALDNGPACSVENSANHAVIDLSFPAVQYLFGGEVGWSDHATVLAEVVDASTPLGPSQGGSSSSSGAGSGSGTGSGSGSGSRLGCWLAGLGSSGSGGGVRGRLGLRRRLRQRRSGGGFGGGSGSGGGFGGGSGGGFGSGSGSGGGFGNGGFSSSGSSSF